MTSEDPLYVPKTGCRMFKVCVYNAEVRELVKSNRSHGLFDDDWAEVHCQQVCASDEGEARQMAEKRYPAKDGFVVSEITALAFTEEPDPIPRRRATGALSADGRCGCARA